MTPNQVAQLQFEHFKIFFSLPHSIIRCSWSIIYIIMIRNNPHETISVLPPSWQITEWLLHSLACRPFSIKWWWSIILQELMSWCFIPNRMTFNKDLSLEDDSGKANGTRWRISSNLLMIWFVLLTAIIGNGSIFAAATVFLTRKFIQSNYSSLVWWSTSFVTWLMPAPVSSSLTVVSFLASIERLIAQQTKPGFGSNPCLSPSQWSPAAPVSNSASTEQDWLSKQ